MKYLIAFVKVTESGQQSLASAVIEKTGKTYNYIADASELDHTLEQIRLQLNRKPENQGDPVATLVPINVQSFPF